MTRVTLVDHPLVQDRLGRLRDATTPSADFRRLLHEASGLLFYEATRNLPTKRVMVNTPVAKSPTQRIKPPVLLVPVLRAGLGMLNGVLPLLPHAEVGFIGLQRDESTLQASTYYNKLPERLNRHQVFLLDPMLATGGSTVTALTTLATRGARRMHVVCLVAAPEGIAHVDRLFPDVRIHTAAVDRKLDRRGFIVPGLGDAGDRIFAS